ncbi:MAG: alpha/beta hydrolase [Phenylobacterium sp.]
MNHLVLTTPYGPLYLVGRVHTNKRQPALLAMGGAWTPDNFLHEVVDWFPGASVLVAPFPGMGGSLTRTFDVTTLARAVDEVIATLLKDVPVVTYGVSTGCLVTLGLRAPEIARHVALEPFFRTAPLWPLHRAIREFIAAAPERVGGAQAAEALFGYTAPPAEQIVDRDYRAVRDGLSAPTDVIVADLPLEPVRQMVGWPSFTSLEDREALAKNPLVTLHRGPAGSGHQVSDTPEGEAQIRDLLRRALLEAAASWKWPDA